MFCKKERNKLCCKLVEILRICVGNENSTRQRIMMKKPTLLPHIITIVFLEILLFPNELHAEPRAQIVNFTCGPPLKRNTPMFVPNFVAAMDNISTQIRTSGFGIAGTGPRPDPSYGLAQCYGDLSLVDCVLCYAEARTILPQCYPANGGSIYLDGCFMRAENYSFFQEYSRPNDHAVCGNRTRRDSGFRESARTGLLQAVADAPNNNGFARERVGPSETRNGSVYVLADCWRTVSASGCRACLENASASLLGCLPASEGRALNTGCFMRYSDTNFLNPIPGNGDSRGRVIITLIATISAAAILIIGAFIGFYMRKKRMIQKKRTGTNYFIYIYENF